MKNKLTGACLIALSIIFMIVAPSRVVMPAAPTAQAEQPEIRSPGLGYLLLAKSGIGIHPDSASAALSSELKGMISELQTNSLPVPAAFVAPANYIAISRHEEVYVNADPHFKATQRIYNLGDPLWTNGVCTGTIVSDSDYGSFLIYAFSTDVGTSSAITVTDSWVKGLTFNTGPSLLSPGGGPVPGTSCDTTRSVFIMAVAVSLPSESSWSYDPKSGTFTINVGSMSSSTFYYLEFYYFAKKTNTSANFFAKKPSQLFSPSTLVSGSQYIVTSGMSQFSVKPPGASWPDYLRVYTRIPPGVAQDGTGIWFVGADPYYWDGSTRPPCSFPGGSCSYDEQGTGVARWGYGLPWDVTSANPIQFSWNHVYYGQLVYSGALFGGCDYENKARVGVDFLSVGTDLVAAQSSYPNNLPKVAAGYPNNVRISMDGTIKMGTVTDSFGNIFDVYNGVESWVDWDARSPVYTIDCQ